MDRVCGLDVHKDSVFMCIITANGEKIEDVFGTLTPELDRLRDTLVSHGVGKVAMEKHQYLLGSYLAHFGMRF